jgi:linoleoyl-CoA desaturase
MTRISFNNKKNLFFLSLKKKADEYFKNRGLHPAGNNRLYVKSSIQVASAVAMYIVLVFFTPGLLISFILCALLGLNLAVLGFNVMHEGVHGSFSRHKWLNRASAYMLNALGASKYYWKMKHTNDHHTFTNVEGLDQDIDVPFMRLHDGQPRYRVHRYQYIYWVFLYAISYFAWIFWADFKRYFTGQSAGRQKLPLKEHIIFWTSKLIYVLVYLVVPISMLGAGATLAGYAIAGASCGLFISIVFQLAHAVESTTFHTLEKDQTKIDQEWAIHQVSTTANFATRNKLLFWLLGGLNFQVEHHLFPRISHIHYPQLSRIVRETCREFNIDYLEHRTMRHAIVSHLSHIRRLGRE